MANTFQPISDLTYRGYDGPLETPNLRWWVIARMSIRQAFRTKSYWVITAFTGWYYVVMMVILFFVDRLATQGGNRRFSDEFLGRIVWKDQFMHGFSFGQLLFLAIALLLGAGAIANDNRSNALLVYLSKPCTKLDYLFGKWFGLFVPLFMAMTLPSLIFYLYGLMSYREFGFLEDRWLLLRVIAMCLAGAAIHSSLVLGISSFFKQGRMAGAAYAGIYFLTNFFTQLMVFAWVIQTNPEAGGAIDKANPLIKTLFYFSIDGLQIGLAKGILGTDGSPWGGIPSRLPSVPAPEVTSAIVVAILLSLGSLLLAWRRIRAVEVVG